MGPEGAVNIIFRKELAATDNPEALRQELVQDRHKFANPIVAAGRGYVDDIIALKIPVQLSTLDDVGGKKGKEASQKHGNIPL